MRVHEIRVHGCEDTAEALALQAPIARLLCPDPGHPPPCDIPWSFTLDDTDGACLILAVITSPERATEVATHIRPLVGEAHPVTVRESDDPGRFEDLIEQHRIESESGQEQPSR
jgi:hypothetical protein